MSRTMMQPLHFSTLSSPLSRQRPSTLLQQFSSLAITSTVAQHSHARSLRPQSVKRTQIRHASTTRRHRKLLNLPPSYTHGGPSDITGSSGRSRTALQHSQKLGMGDHIVFDPAPTPPNPYHTPMKFLPKGDIRRVLYERSLNSSSSPSSSPSSSLFSASANVSTNSNVPWPESAELPPAITPVNYKKRYHLGPKEIEEIRALRTSNEKKWTQRKLARKFNCSKFFVSTIATASKERREKLDQVLQERRRTAWSTRRRTAYYDRQKRLAILQRDE